ncbi:4192_t:CDS:2 [Funneliformis mosseae]|uniref:4192_t:CDS:1 n=1 Tax=Funneliformis mosseae TaxID=27381 RepID=A0A9N9EDX9_FUNMO|nr:4192_t:CDS:2 [Funneliformis mosseae]
MHSSTSKKVYAETSTSSMCTVKILLNKPNAYNLMLVTSFPEEYEEYVLSNIINHTLRLSDFNLGKLKGIPISSEPSLISCIS